MDQNDNMSYGVWDLSKLRNNQTSKNHQITESFAAYVSDRNLGMPSPNDSASKFQEYPTMDGVIDMSSKVPTMNKVSVIKNSADQMQKFSPTKQTSLKNYTRTREKAEYMQERPDNTTQNNITSDLQFRIFGSEVGRETSHMSNHPAIEKSTTGRFLKQNLNCRLNNNHSQKQNSIFPEATRTYQKCKIALECEHKQQSLNHQDNLIWNPAKDLPPANHRQSSFVSNNQSRASNNGLSASHLPSDIALNDTKMTSFVEDDVQEVYSISDDDSQGKVEMRVEENSEVISVPGEESNQILGKRTIIVRDSDPNEEVYFICEDGDDDNNDEVEDVEMVNEDGERQENDDDDVEEDEINDGDLSATHNVCQNGDVIDYQDDNEDDYVRKRKCSSDIESSTRSRPRRGRRPRNSLMLSQSRSSAKQDDCDSEEGLPRFSSLGRRRGRGRGGRRGWSNRGGRGASASKRARPMKRSSMGRMSLDGEDYPKKEKKQKITNMFIADKISSATAAAASVTQSIPVEYLWPKGRSGEWYVLQEHVTEFLDVLSFKRKYPDISRRQVEYQERQFLCEQGCVTEMQCDLGLTALKVDEVLDLMAKDYPEKYQEYTKVSRKIKSTEKPVEKNTTEGPTKAESLLKRAIKSAMNFNSSLLRERMSERQTYFDLQTLEIHHPIGRPKMRCSSVKLCDSYPLALLPGQFQEFFKSYTPEELKYFPINTALYAPHKPVHSIYADPVETVSDEEEDRTNHLQNNNSSSISVSKQGRPRPPMLNRFHEKSEIDLNGSDSNLSFSSSKKAKRGGSLPGKAKKVIVQQARCGMCNQTNRNKYNDPDDLVKCNSCAVSNHPGCLGLSREMIPVIKTYNWQCMECKTCFKCTEPHDEDKMMFCDHCDRGYHTYCVGVVCIPEGRWDCSMCFGKFPHLGADPSTLPNSTTLAFPGKTKPPETSASRPKPKRGRPFKYPRDENNVRIVSTQQDLLKNAPQVEDSSPESRSKTYVNIPNRVAASNESAVNSPSSGSDQRVSITSNFSESRQQQGTLSSVEVKKSLELQESPSV